MDIAVCIKQTVDTEAEVGVDAEGRALTEGQTLVIDPYSEFAVERAVQLAEEHGGDVSVVCVGGDEAVPAVRHALSMGASAGYLVDDAALAEADAAVKARVLAAALERVPADLVQTMPRVSELRGLPCVQVVTALDVDPAAGVAHATREIDDGVAVVDVALPAVITAQQGLAEPRYPNVRAIMQSKKKPVTVWTLADLGIEDALVDPRARRTRVVRYRPKPARQGGRIVEGETVAEAVAATVELLETEAKVW